MEETPSLSRIFFARMRGSRADDLARSASSIEADLQALDAAARAAWPEIELDSQAFAAHIADRARGRPDAAETIRTLHAADLFLACACSSGSASALAAFERVHLSRVPGLIRRIDRSDAFADDVTQTLRETLLVPMQSHGARIAEYSGRGPLTSWIRVIAVRTALHLRHEQRRGSASNDEKESQRAGPVDPELDYLKLRYRSAYERAFELALSALPDRDALLLKLHYLDGLSIDRIGALYGIHRSTVARWRSNVRRVVLESTRKHLRAQLALTDSEFDSLVALVRSQLAVNIRAALQRPPAANSILKG
jgi:RNA polymerase sigma-70 factor (ECF subfamily)